MDWYYADSGRQIGPLDDLAFRQAVGQGSVRSDTLVWHAGLANWIPYRSLTPDLVPAAPTPFQPVAPTFGSADAPTPAATGESRFCAECGMQYPASEMVAFGAAVVCANCKPIYAQKLREGVLKPVRFVYGGFWIRAGALLIDGIILWIVNLVPTALIFGVGRFNTQDFSSLMRAEGILIVLNLLVGFTYETLFLSKFGATPGKMACNLRVVNADGSPINFQKAAARYGAKLISSFTLGVGYIMAGVDEEKRALHDRICDTRVVRK